MERADFPGLHLHVGDGAGVGALPDGVLGVRFERRLDDGMQMFAVRAVRVEKLDQRHGCVCFTHTGIGRIHERVKVIDDGFPGNWVISIEEQARFGQEPAIWAATWPGTEETGRFGVVVTRDGGETFEALLRGERVYDFAFDGSTVYIAGENGLFISNDDGRTFRTVRDFFDPTQPDRTFRPGARVFSVEVLGDVLWVGTEDGLFKSLDNGLTWRVFRAEVPLSPDGLPAVVPTELVPRVEAYAYPNPFSPSVDRFVRIRYKLESDQTVKIRVFDFAMNLVRNLTEEQQSGGEREVSWDGTDNQGARVANGAYFYAVEAGGETFWGKVLVLE